MKKIVALVLSLVMVLGLATVAMADSTTTTLDGDDYSIYQSVAGVTAPSVEDEDITKTVTGNVITTEDDETTVKYTATVYSAKDIYGTTVYFAEVNALSADYKLVKDGAVVAYLKLLAGNTAPQTEDVVASYVASVDEPECGEYDKADYALGVVVIDNVPYAVGGGKWAVLNGQFVSYGGVATAEAHSYKAATFSTTKHTDVETVKCTLCGETWDVLSVAEVAGMAPTAFKQVSVDVAGTATNLYIAVAAASAPAVDTEKVESAETFDAGIAMYVGMSVMAAAGSAVVLKKKD